jgi:hypothetical protein
VLVPASLHRPIVQAGVGVAALHVVRGLADVLAQHEPGLQSLPQAGRGEGLLGGAAVGGVRRVGDGDVRHVRPGQVLHPLQGRQAPPPGQRQPPDGVGAGSLGLQPAGAHQLLHVVDIGREEQVIPGAGQDLLFELAGGAVDEGQAGGAGPLQLRLHGGEGAAQVGGRRYGDGLRLSRRRSVGAAATGE